MGGAGTGLARGSTIRALGSARGGATGGGAIVFAALRGSVFEMSGFNAAAAARGSNALARGSATLEGGTGNGTPRGVPGVDLTDSEV
mmetsp:Transcript_12044/g.25481  ORF Transcript_12044/g.25481 Transcript_12044/m.25481 type:complete len:87 (+) Transcript_12044:966-1226(+)